MPSSRDRLGLWRSFLCIARGDGGAQRSSVFRQEIAILPIHIIAWPRRESNEGMGRELTRTVLWHKETDTSV
jgi:hypothetical protein